MNVSIERLLMQSVYYSLRELLHSEGLSTDSALSGFPYVSVVLKDEHYSSLSSPGIVVYPATFFDSPLQLGGGWWIKALLVMEVYGTTDGQMLELVSLCRRLSERGFSVLRYDINQPDYQVIDGTIRTIYSGDIPATIATADCSDYRAKMNDRETRIGESNAHSAQITTVVEVPQ